MTVTHLTPGDLAARSNRAVAAATDVGRRLGLHVTEPTILHDMFSVVVHLAPSPVVARVPVVLPPQLDAQAQRARQARELAAVAWLSHAGHPVVRPTPLLPCEPVQHDGFSITLWEWVAVAPNQQPDYVASASLVPALHAALRDYPAGLPFLSPIAISVPSCLAFLQDNPELLAAKDLERAQREWALLSPVLSSPERFSAEFPRASLQAIHGDAPSYNVIDTIAGPRYADFEDVTLGPPEWDLALLGIEAASAYDAAAVRVGLRPLDADTLRVMDSARMLQLVTCFALAPQLPMLAAGLAPSLEHWRTMPLAGGLG
jgi:hypothetical protein